MVDPDMKPVPQAEAQVFVQSWNSELALPFATGVVLPATAPAVTLPIMVSAAGFLLIDASASGTLSAPRMTAMIVRVDGVKVLLTAVSHFGGAGEQMTFGVAGRIPITAGAHTVTVEFGNTVAALVFACDPFTKPDLDSCSVVVSEVAA